ncbi:6151_t:CDS:2, partial [Paraglomus occultum]
DLTISHQGLNNAQNSNFRIRLTKPKKSQTEVPDKANLTRARRGLKAEDPLSDSEQ